MIAAYVQSCIHVNDVSRFLYLKTNDCEIVRKLTQN